MLALAMSSQNFDPDWAKHLKHDPNRPLGVGCPEPPRDWMACYEQSGLKGRDDRDPDPFNHDENRRPEGAIEPTRKMIPLKLTIRETGETMEMPAETATTLQEVAERLAWKLKMGAEEIRFVCKQGSMYRIMYPHEQVARNMTVKGIKSFKRHPHKYKHPQVIIGAGHIGLRMCMFNVERKNKDFVCFDRMFRVGGTSWMYQANSTSKLQTEYGAYHLDYDETSPIPEDFTTPWPSRNALLDHFQGVSERTGIMPHIRLNTNVKNMEVIEGPKDWSGSKHLKNLGYEITTEKMAAGRLKYGKLVAMTQAEEDAKTEEDEVMNACSVCMFPGNLTLPRKEEYKGEDVFGGDIGYAMFNEIDYHKLQGLNVTIVGHGAFAVENIRTCCEFDINQIYMVCRRKNLSCPRVASWITNRTMNPFNNARFMRAMEPMYAMLQRQHGEEEWDPWGYHSVQANEKKTTCQITQKARFGIGDIYFLSIYMGKCECICDPGGVKRLTKGEVHLVGGRKLQCSAILKLLGLVGELENDRLLKIRELVGFWVNGDCRRYIVSEPLSVMCSQMGGTSLSPGAYVWGLEGLHFIEYPTDFSAGPESSGMLPKHKPDLTDEHSPRPAYVVDARHGTTTAMAVGMFSEAIQEVEQAAGFVKAVRHRLCHPIRKFLAQAKEDWDHYAKKMIEGGFGTDRPYPDYPYDHVWVNKIYSEHMEDSEEPPLPCDEADIAVCYQIEDGSAEGGGEEQWSG